MRDCMCCSYSSYLVSIFAWKAMNLSSSPKGCTIDWGLVPVLKVVFVIFSLCGDGFVWSSHRWRQLLVLDLQFPFQATSSLLQFLTNLQKRCVRMWSRQTPPMLLPQGSNYIPLLLVMMSFLSKENYNVPFAFMAPFYYVFNV